MSEPLEACRKCGAKAVWAYMPADGDGAYCDECVPRGCGCNVIDWQDPSLDAEQERDERGRLLPCVEYGYDEDGWSVISPPS